jgi:hypothetical protein
MKTNDDLYNAIQAGEVTENPKIEVDVFSGGPIGGCGFRSGWWDVKLDGIKFKIHSSIPHSMTLEEQKERLVSSVESAIEHAKNPKYVSQMKRVNPTT